jgi:NADH-quinone oxidoreductase subunit C
MADQNNTGAPGSSAERKGADEAELQARGAQDATAGEVEQAGEETTPEGGTRIGQTRERRGMFGVSDSGDTSGFGGLRLPAHVPAPAERPFGGWFDDFADEFAEALSERGIPRGAVQQITIDRGEITFYIRRERIVDICRTLRDEEGLRFELCSSVSGVDYGADVPQRLHVVYHLTSMTFPVGLVPLRRKHTNVQHDMGCGLNCLWISPNYIRAFIS